MIYRIKLHYSNYVQLRNNEKRNIKWKKRKEEIKRF
jgi:hypothetical protein